jgi:poly(hydroxyalkanoate) granule-associated protein
MKGVEAARENAALRVEEARTRATAAMNQLERAFEARVTRAMSRLGVPTAREVRALAREVAALKASVQRLARSRARA